MSPQKKLLVTSVSLLTFAFSFSVFADPASDESEIAELRGQLVALSLRLDALEKSNSDLKIENSLLQSSGQEAALAIKEINRRSDADVQQRDHSSADSWTDKIAIKGDFRQRYENIDEEGKFERNRNRIRARAAIVANVTNQAEVGLGFASGGEDPVSTNQTLGGGGSTKAINLDLAYVRWVGSNNLTYYGGKFKNFLIRPAKHAMLWDGDWNPEGLGLTWNNGDFFANAMGSWLESDGNKETEFSYTLQAGLKKTFDNGMRLTAGLGYYQIGTKGKGSFFGDDNDFFGNSFDPVTKTYLYDYEEIEIFADLGFMIGDNPASVFVDYVQNQATDEFDKGYSAGFKFNNASSKGVWEWTYIYQDLEADAALGLVADSDFAGGGTDGRGHIFKGGYGLAKNVKASFTYFKNERSGDLGSEKDYDRLQLDLALKY
jgi:hypothetical protein